MPFAAAKRLTNAGAKKMMVAAIEKAEEIGIPATVAIVDAGGHMMMLERMDGGRFHTVHSSTTKAVTASGHMPGEICAGCDRVSGQQLPCTTQLSCCF